MVIKTCVICVCVCVRACVCTGFADQLEADWPRCLSPNVSDSFVFFSRIEINFGVNTGVSRLDSLLGSVCRCRISGRGGIRGGEFLFFLNYTETVAKSISAPIPNPVELSNVTVLTFLRLTFIKQ